MTFAYFVYPQAIEYTQKGEQTASCVLPAGKGLGGVFLGGFKSVVNAEFLRSSDIRHIVNTAKGLEIFGPKYTVMLSECLVKLTAPLSLSHCLTFSLQEAVKNAKNDLQIKFLDLNWEDTITFSIPDSDLVECVKFIHEARKQGGSVLVHCAQVYPISLVASPSLLYARRGASY